MTAGLAVAAAFGLWVLSTAAVYTAGAQVWYRGLGRGTLKEGPLGSRAVAFTFDDGPVPVWTARIAEILEAAGARGTFFVLAEQALRLPGEIRRLSEGGHEIALHGFNHRHLWLMGPRETCEKLQEAAAVVERLTGGHAPRFYRPPWGHFNMAAAVCARRMGMRIALWSAAPPDWARRPRPEALAKALIGALRPGAIIDLHDGGPPGRAQVLVDVLPAALRQAHALGLHAVTLSELLGRDGASGGS